MIVFSFLLEQTCLRIRVIHVMFCTIKNFLQSCWKSATVSGAFINVNVRGLIALAATACKLTRSDYEKHT